MQLPSEVDITEYITLIKTSNKCKKQIDQMEAQRIIAQQ